MALMLFLAFLLINYPALGDGLKCYSYRCTNMTGIPEYSDFSHCPPPKEMNCSSYDTHCMTERYTKAEFRSSYGKYLYTTVERRECTKFADMSTKCHIPNSYCKSVNSSGEVVSCNTGCCQGDLCNDGILPPRVPEKTGPITGLSLSCFSCSNDGWLSDSPTKNCDQPVVVSCGVRKTFGIRVVNDRCMTVKAVRKFGSHREVVNVRGCADPYYCNQDFACKYLNRSGEVESCNMSCCFGKNCNGPGKVPESILSCYSCKSLKDLDWNVADAKCTSPAKQECLYTDVNEQSEYENNRCVKANIAYRGKKDRGLISFEVRHCSSSKSYFCYKDIICASYNKSGSLVKCDVGCCTGDYCNNDEFLTPTSSSTQGPSSTQVPSSTPKSSSIQQPFSKASQNALLLMIGLVFTVLW